MRSFTDNAGRTWAVRVTVDTIRRVRALTDTDLMCVVGGDLLERLAADPVLLVDVIYSIIKPDADKLGVTGEMFGESLAGDVIESAADAMMGAIVDFFPKRRGRVLAAILEKSKKIEDESMDRAMEWVDALTRESLTKSGPTSGDSPESAE